MLGLAKRIMHLFAASTSEVYGDPEVHPQKEDYWVELIQLVSGHAMMGKRSAETLFFDYNRQHNLV